MFAFLEDGKQNLSGQLWRSPQPPVCSKALKIKLSPPERRTGSKSWFLYAVTDLGEINRVKPEFGVCDIKEYANTTFQDNFRSQNLICVEKLKNLLFQFTNPPETFLRQNNLQTKSSPQRHLIKILDFLIVMNLKMPALNAYTLQGKKNCFVQPHPD